jgi:hypothetical protein
MPKTRSILAHLPSVILCTPLRVGNASFFFSGTRTAFFHRRIDVCEVTNHSFADVAEQAFRTEVPARRDAIGVYRENR